MKKILTTLMIVALAACQKSEEPIPEVSGTSEVVFTSGISTRVTGTTWDEGDQIGVFMYYNGSKVESNSNVLYSTEDAASGTFTSTDPILYPSDGNAVDFIAYHPYTMANVNNLMILNTADQSTAEDLKANDFMVAAVQNCSEESSPVLNFSRKMSKIAITVGFKGTKEDGAILSDVSLSDIVTDGTYAISNAEGDKDAVSIEAWSTISDISLFYDEDNSVIEAIIIPQTVTSSTLMLSVDGELFGVNFSGTFAENTQYNYNLVVGNEKVELTAGDITEWGEVIKGDLGLTAFADISYNSTTETYEIASANGMRAFADLVNGSGCSVTDLTTSGDESYFNFGTSNTSINGKLLKDIDLGGIYAEGNGVAENEFTCIGASSYWYRGTFDGNGYEISGLYIDQENSNYKGLFGYINGATIKNLGVSGSVTGNQHVGGVVGIAWASTVSNCYYEGSVEAMYYYAGGVVGYASASNTSYTIIENCYNKGEVNSSSDYVGGIAGKANGTKISKCYNSGSIKSENKDYVGGIVGCIAKYNSASTSEVFLSTIDNCYNTGSVDASDYVGGILGINNDSYDENEGFYVSNCYNTGCISATGDVGAIVGYISYPIYRVFYCYYDNELSGVSGAVYGNDVTITLKYYGLSTDMMKSSTTTEGSLLYYLTNESYGNSSEWVPDTNNINNGYPVLTWQTSNN